MRIPFNKASFSGNEYVYLGKALESGHVTGDGGFTRQCSEFLETTLDIPKALLTTSCTHALEMAALLLDIKPGDEVIVPSFTFVSTINAFVLRGARPVFIDIRQDTLNLDETQLEGLISSQTRAVVPVHYAGVGCEMDRILAICQQHGISVVEDNAHGLFGRYKGKFLGTFGILATQSFHGTKNFNCGEGGALLVNDPNLVERAEILREKGTNRSRFFRGQVDKYTWVDIGSSYLPSDILAAILMAQFEDRQKIQGRRQEIWEKYHRKLGAWADGLSIQAPSVPPYCEQTYHMYYLLLPSVKFRQSLIGYLKGRGIQSVFHYLPLHLSDMGRQFGGREGDCPVTESVSERLLRLPFYNSLTVREQDQVIEALLAYPGEYN